MNSNKIFQPTRRNFLLGMLAAPLVVRAASIMPVKVVPVFDAAAMNSALARALAATREVVAQNVLNRAFTITLNGWDQYGNPIEEVISGMPGETVRSDIAWGQSPEQLARLAT